MSYKVFENQTANITKRIKLKPVTDGTLEGDLFGELDGADFRAYYVDAFGNLCPIAVLTWALSSGDTFSGAAGGLIYIHAREFVFELSNVGATTSIDFSISHDASPGFEVVP